MGTHVVPEFGAFSIIILGMSFVGIIYFARASLFGSIWTRIN
ncbi:MAG: PEFG-CTERM sorting domain-containing protein [Thermoproteota archaeon]